MEYGMDKSQIRGIVSAIAVIFIYGLTLVFKQELPPIPDNVLEGITMLIIYLIGLFTNITRKDNDK